MSASAQRTYVIPPLVDEVDGAYVVNREKAADLMLDMLGTLIQLGGRFEIQADRVQVGELPRGSRPPEPIGETLGFIAAYRTIPKISDEPETLRLLGLEQEPEPEPDRADDDAGLPDGEFFDHDEDEE